MTYRSDHPESVYYTICVKGLIGEEGSNWFEGMDIKVNEEASKVQTLISGYIEDQAALFGLIKKIQGFGLTLVSVTQTEMDTNEHDHY